MTNQEILKIIEGLEMYKHKNVHTSEQILKDHSTITRVRENLEHGRLKENR